MSSSRRRRFLGSVGARLVLGFCLFFTVGSLIVFAFSYYLLGSALAKKDRELVDAKLKEYALVVGQRGVSGLAALASARGPDAEAAHFLVRLQDDDGRTIYSYVPSELYGLDASALFRNRMAPMPEGDAALEVASTIVGETRLSVAKVTVDRDDVLEDFRRITLAVFGVTIVIGVLGGTIFARSTLRPLQGLLATIRAIERGNVGARVTTSGTGDELDELGRHFNSMLSHVQSLIQGMRDTLDNVAHDLRTPLSRMRGIAEMAIDSPSPTLRDEALSECVEASEEVLQLLDAIMDLSEVETGAMKLRREGVNLDQLARQAADLYQFPAEAKQVVIEVVGHGLVPVVGDRVRLGQAISNLVDNAVKFSRPHGRVILRSSTQGMDAIISVADAGVGIASDDLPRIWERLFRGDTSRASKGLGLGLSLVRAVATAHGGRVEVVSTLGQGSVFTLVLPGSSAGEPERL